ncbi:MAG: hypothetical protein ACI9ON_003047 [Limisphaerales bacterium]
MKTSQRAARAARHSSGTGSTEAPSEDHSEVLKNLLQQFTKDSREMMQCIQELEKENAELKAQLGDNETPETEVELTDVAPSVKDNAA